MSSEKKLLLNKLCNHSYWKNNYINKQYYSNFFFQLKLLKNIIFFFFTNNISNNFLNKKKITKIIYISQIWINSFNNNLIISFNIYLKDKNIYNHIIPDNYLRLKFLYKYLNNLTIV